MNKKILKLITVAAAFALGLSSCGGGISNKPSTDGDESTEPAEDQKYSIYLMAKSAGYEGTYEDWLDSIKGLDGFSLLHGVTDPTVTTGSDGDMYINTSSWDVFAKALGVWTKVGNIMGGSGPQGPAGPQGEDGKTAWGNTILPSENGYVTVNVGSAVEGENVIFTAHPDYGFELAAIYLNDVNYIEEVDETTLSITVPMVKNGYVVKGIFEEPVAPVEPEKPSKNGYYITGDRTLKVDGKTAEESGGSMWSYGGDSFKLKEITLVEAKEIDAEVGGKLEDRGFLIKKIYSISGVEVGVDDAGWSKKMLLDGELYEANGSYCLKIIECTYNEESERMVTSLWTPDPVTAHVENLKNYFCPTWQEEKDEYGFSWIDTPVVTDGAGIYTVIFAEYDTSPTVDTYNFGTAFIKTEEKEGQEYAKINEWNPEDHTYGVVGSLTSWYYDLSMTEAEGVWGGIYDFSANDEFKVRADGEWVYSWGSASVINKGEVSNYFDFSGDNIKVKIAGSYGVALQFDGNGAAQIILGIPMPN